MLVVRRGANLAARYVLDPGTTTLGRSPDSDIFLDDLSVSRRQTVITVDGRRSEVCDAGSLNGTYVNGERIDTGVTLENGDQVQVGVFKFVYLCP